MGTLSMSRDTILVKKAACKTSDPEELYTLLAKNLEQESDRRAFLAGGP